jgi:hypothetical protein
MVDCPEYLIHMIGIGVSLGYFTLNISTLVIKIDQRAMSLLY